jgi:hypothetical protein
VETWRFILMQAPLTLLSVAVGSFFLLRPLRNVESTKDPAGFHIERMGSFLWETMPILVVVGFIIAFALIRGVFGLVGIEAKLPTVLPLLLGLVACLIWVVKVNRLGFHHLKAALLNKNTIPMLLLIFGIMVFKGALVDSQAVFQIREEMVRYHIPILVVIVAMPFISGFITGIAIGFVGASFPLVVPLFSGLPPLDFLAHASLAYAAGYMGMMLSPVHICLLVTRDYFKASLAASYRHLYKPVIAVMMIWAVLLGAIVYI